MFDAFLLFFFAVCGFPLQFVSFVLLHEFYFVGGEAECFAECVEGFDFGFVGGGDFEVLEEEQFDGSKVFFFGVVLIFVFFFLFPVVSLFHD